MDFYYRRKDKNLPGACVLYCTKDVFSFENSYVHVVIATYKSKYFAKNKNNATNNIKNSLCIAITKNGNRSWLIEYVTK